ncbi:MAG: hypothetical protein VXW00_16205, partial [Candidatus Latescibacterota bacterium]|nr:hypothetical protein [Candidatus Latescibacterota bacterium]
DFADFCTSRIAAVPAKFANKIVPLKNFSREGKHRTTSRNHRKNCPGFPLLTKNKIETAKSLNQNRTPTMDY